MHTIKHKCSELLKPYVNCYNKNQSSINPHSFKITRNNSLFPNKFPDHYKVIWLRKVTVEVSLETCGNTMKCSYSVNHNEGITNTKACTSR